MTPALRGTNFNKGDLLFLNLTLAVFSLKAFRFRKLNPDGFFFFWPGKQLESSVSLALAEEEQVEMN